MSDTELDRFIWIDLETFGLNSKKDPVIEIGILVTDPDLNEVDEFSQLIWDGGRYEERFLQMRNNDSDQYVLEMHTRSGLWQAARKEGIPLTAAHWNLQAFLQDYQLAGKDPLCGSSVQFDREMLRRYMPAVEQLFSYRNIDVSTVKELCRRLNPDVYSKLPPKREQHRVLADLRDTINEFKFYRDEFLIWEPAA